MVDQTVKSWIAGLTVQERGEIVDTVYDLLQTTEADRVQELMQPKNVYSVLKAFIKEDDQSRRLVAEAVGELLKTAVQNAAKLKRQETERKEKP